MEKSGHIEKIKSSSIVIDSTEVCIGIKRCPKCHFSCLGYWMMIALTELRRYSRGSIKVRVGEEFYLF